MQPNLSVHTLAGNVGRDSGREKGEEEGERYVLLAIP